MLSEISLQNPTIVRMLKWQVGITVGFAVIAGIVSGEHGAVSAVLGGLTNIFASIVYVAVANFGLSRTNGAGLWPLLRAELVKLVFIAIQLGVIIKFYDSLVLLAMFATFLVTLLAWRAVLLVTSNQSTR
ncbi:MAG: ATP synthase subunit I [Casimicrobium sp.]